MYNPKLYFQLLAFIFCIAVIASCDNSKKVSGDTDPEQVAPDYHNLMQAHTHSPCRVANNTNIKQTADVPAKNITALVRSKNSYLYNQNLKVIITPPDCKLVGEDEPVIESNESYSTRVVGFTMLQYKNGKWVTTPPEYVAYSPKKISGK